MIKFTNKTVKDLELIDTKLKNFVKGFKKQKKSRMNIFSAIGLLTLMSNFKEIKNGRSKQKTI